MQTSIDNVTSQLFPGKVQCYKIDDRSTPAVTNNPDVNPVANWEWTDEDPTALGYELYLNTIIVPEQPEANEETFEAGIPLAGTEQKSRSLILFSPNYQLIASLDNQNSQVTSGCGASFTRGFSQSTGQTIGISQSVGVGIKVFSAELTTEWSMSFTEEWNESITKQMNFSCPGRERAFVYQGTLVYRILEFDATSGEFSWEDDAARALTETLLTTKDPIMAPSDSITFEQQ